MDRRGTHNLWVGPLALCFGAAMLCLSAFMIDGAPNLKLTHDAMIALIWLGLLPTGFAYLLRYYIVRKVGVSFFALAMNTVPIFGIIIAAIYLGETIHNSTLIALVLVLSGLAIARGFKSRNPSSGSQANERSNRDN